MAIQTADNKWSTAKWIVNPTEGLGTHTTIQSAVTAASSGDIIVIMPKSGGYTEDITMKAGITLTAYIGQEQTPDVYIIGKMTCAYSGTSSISGLYLRTNSDNFLTFTGTNACNLEVENCVLYAFNADGITCTNNNASLVINRSYTYTEATYKLFDMSPSALAFRFCYVTNSGTTVLSDIDNGYIEISNCVFSVPFSVSSAARLVVYNSSFYNGYNTTPITYQSSDTTGYITNTELFTGTATALILDTGSIDMLACSVFSGNTAAISGTGTLRYAGLSFKYGGSSNITVTTQNIGYEGPSKNIGSTNSGGTNILTVMNASNTASSGATIACNVAGSSAGDARYQASTTATSWSWGADNSDSDALVFSQGTTLGTNNVIRASTAGYLNYPLQCAFKYYQGSNAANVTGNGTTYLLGKSAILTKIFDQNNNVYPGDGAGNYAYFTAPVTGIYYLEMAIRASSLTGVNSTYTIISTSGFNEYYQSTLTLPSTQTFLLSGLFQMNASDAANFQIILNGKGADTCQVDGLASPNGVTWISGYLVA